MKNKKSSNSRNTIQLHKQIRTIVGFTTLVFLAKVAWLYSQPGRGLLGADGENYLQALSGLFKEGFFSTEGKLTYWPAGYPILMWPISEINTSNFVFVVGFLQSLLFAISIAYFTVEICKSTLRRFAWPITFILNFSPTLTLNTVVIGYETTTAALLMLAVTMYMRATRLNEPTVLNFEHIFAAIAIAMSCFMQPRILLLALGILVPYAIYRYRGSAIPIFMAFTLSIVFLAPGVLMFRNYHAQGFVSISTNLGNTMNIGAGDKASGGYTNNATGVPCERIVGNAATQDSHLVKCVIKWYLSNPAHSVKLVTNKFWFHWSPWFGPNANGTMARNPWLNFHPLKQASETASGSEMINGRVGRVISFAWVVGSLFFLCFGFYSLRRRGGSSSLLAWCLFLPVVLNTFSSLLTIGDNRFRIPTMTLSLSLQILGIYAVFNRSNFAREMDGKLRLKHANKLEVNKLEVNK